MSAETAGTGRVARNSLLQGGADAVGKVGTIVLYAVMARKVGTQGFGDFTTSASLSVLMMVAAFGMDYRITRLVARGEDVAGAFWSAVVLKSVLGAGMLLVLVFVTTAGPYDAQVPVCTALLGLAILVELGMLTPHAVFRGMEQLRPVAVALILYRVTLAVLGVAVLLAGASIEAVAAGWLASAVLALAYTVRRIRGTGLQFPFRVTRRSLRAVGVDSIGLGLAVVLGATLARLDIVILSALKDSEAVALYGGAYRLMESTQFLTAALALASFPALARLTRTSSPTIAQATALTTKVVLILTLPIAVLFVVYAEPVLTVFYGRGFVDGAATLRLLAPVVVFSGLVNLVTFMLSSQQRQRPIVMALAVATAVNLVANLLLIPPYGIEGAAVAWGATSVVMCGLMIGPTLRATGPLPLARTAFGPAAGAVAMATTGVTLGAGAVSVVPACVAFAAVLTLVERVVYPDDAGRLRRALRRRPGVG